MIFPSALLIGVSVVLMAPIVWIVSISLKPMTEIVKIPPTLLPTNVQWQNYAETIRTFPFIRYTLNTLFITFFVVIGNILSNSFIAYGFAKISFPGHNMLFSLVLTTMMILGFVTMIPQYVLFSKIGWVGTYLPLIVPSFFGNAFSIFIMRQFYMSISNKLVEAAKIDGASHIFFRSRDQRNRMDSPISCSKPCFFTIFYSDFHYFPLCGCFVRSHAALGKRG